MSFDYSPLVNTAINLLNKFGRSATLRKRVVSGSAFDPTITYEDVNITIVSSAYKIGDIDGTLIKSGDKKLYVYSSENLEKGLEIIDDSETLEIIEINLIKPGNAKIMNILQARLK